ncbi:MAG: HD domain-containing protein [Candidatus Caldarchaeum sp.]
MLLKRVRRSGWLDAGVRQPESVADHSFSLAVLAMVEAEKRGLDCLKAVKMALIHDIPESYTGDLTPRIKKRIPAKLLESVETSVLKQLFAELGPKHAEEVVNVYREYLKDCSPEARLVHMLDKKEMMLEACWLMHSQRVDLRKFAFRRHGFIPRFRSR